MIYQSPSIVVNIIENNIAELSFCSEARVNVLNLETLSDLDKAIDQIYNHPELTGLVLTSDKDSFIVGADIKEFLTLFSKPENELGGWLEYANSIFNKLEDLPIPSISAIRGHVLGGGCECVLATDFRIGDKTTSIGQPETKLGIMPGFGGTVRLPRVIGSKVAAEMIATGGIYCADEALAVGLLDQVTLSEELKSNTLENRILIQSAITTLKQAINEEINWRAKRAQKKSPFIKTKAEVETLFSVKEIASKLKLSPENFAPMTALRTLRQSAFLERDKALDIERLEFIKLAKSPQAKQLIKAFLTNQALKNKK